MKLWWLGLVIITLAILFRVCWIYDMEWKADEQQLYQMAAMHAKAGTWPSTGLISGVGFVNSGVSVWPFILFYKLSTNPVHMALCVGLLNILGLLLMFYLASKSGTESRVLFFGVALMAVNVLSVVFSRKLWAQDLLPMITALLWAFQFLKNKKLAYFLMGFLSLLAGQIHISGFFICTGLCVSLWIFESEHRKKLIYFFLGIVVTLLPAIPWLKELFANPNSSDVHVSHILRFEYFLHALTDPLGINVLYSLGMNEAKLFLIMGPWGATLYIPAVCILGILVISIYAITRINWNRIQFNSNSIKNSPLMFNLLAFVVIPGLLLTCTGSPIRSHYLIMAGPFLHTAFAKLWLISGLKNAITVIVLQATITALFLLYIHHSAVIKGDYGMPYKYQNINEKYGK